jgi:hypothetical protein
VRLPRNKYRTRAQWVWWRHVMFTRNRRARSPACIYEEPFIIAAFNEAGSRFTTYFGPL